MTVHKLKKNPFANAGTEIVCISKSADDAAEQKQVFAFASTEMG